MIDKKFPCCNCITLAVCKAEYRDNNITLNRIVSKCSLIKDYITESEYVYAEDGSKTGTVKIDRICLLNFKIFMEGTKYGTI